MDSNREFEYVIISQAQCVGSELGRLAGTNISDIIEVIEQMHKLGFAGATLMQQRIDELNVLVQDTQQRLDKAVKYLKLHHIGKHLCGCSLCEEVSEFLESMDKNAIKDTPFEDLMSGKGQMTCKEREQIIKSIDKLNTKEGEK